MTDYLREYMEDAIPGKKIEDVHVDVMRMFVTAMNTGIYNLDIRWNKMELKSTGITFAWRPHVRGLSTFDYNHLTRLVLLAHERSIRAEIEPRAPGYFGVFLFQRAPFPEKQQSHEYHPSLEQALSRLNEHSPWLQDALPAEEQVPA